MHVYFIHNYRLEYARHVLHIFMLFVREFHGMSDTLY